MIQYTIQEYKAYLRSTHIRIRNLIERYPEYKYSEWLTWGAFKYAYKKQSFECQILWDRLKIDDTWHYGLNGASVAYILSIMMEHAMRSYYRKTNQQIKE